MEICRAVEPDLSRYLDRDLPAERAAEVAAHLGECPACRCACDGLDRVRRAVRSLDIDPALAASARGRVLDRVRATRSAAPALRLRRPALGWGLSLAGAMATACLLLLLPSSEPPAEALPTPGEIGLLFDLHDAHAAGHLPAAQPEAAR